MRLRSIVKTSFAISIFVVISGAYMKLTHRDGAEILLIISMISMFIFILAAINGVRSSHKIKDTEKMLWTIGFIRFSAITGIVYILIGRKHIANSY